MSSIKSGSIWQLINLFSKRWEERDKHFNIKFLWISSWDGNLLILSFLVSTNNLSNAIWAFCCWIFYFFYSNPKSLYFKMTISSNYVDGLKTHCTLKQNKTNLQNWGIISFGVGKNVELNIKWDTQVQIFGKSKVSAL